MAFVKVECDKETKDLLKSQKLILTKVPVGDVLTTLYVSLNSAKKLGNEEVEEWAKTNIYVIRLDGQQIVNGNTEIN